ncbi:hypothetical protein G9P44_002629 [Scheffersomyces stipitis]|nr:hypothetical protein G9P44_002629 [Scheffersomyces stipitis]
MNLDASRWRMLQLCRYLDSSAVLKYSIQNLFDNAVEKASEKKRTFSDHDAQPQEFHLRSVMISITCSTNLSSKVALGDKALVRKRRRKIHSPEIRAILEKEFSLDPSPSRAHRKSIAVRCNMSTSEVRIWFANRRNRFKRYQ